MTKRPKTAYAKKPAPIKFDDGPSAHEMEDAKQNLKLVDDGLRAIRDMLGVMDIIDQSALGSDDHARREKLERFLEVHRKCLENMISDCDRALMHAQFNLGFVRWENGARVEITEVRIS
ncbi:hypothetical protein [Methylosinus sp. KRF6]|uniref:hypothetical protein n=1 Tax=Methylosinus sp. KRF6 TaxID=2846853 RepID=UPI001C0E845E|nr:hypothetical protein [Methylosinus sp. KRF6]MBU3889856.1 hypothetical protein [Methylosinus sp. KRF6]